MPEQLSTLLVISSSIHVAQAHSAETLYRADQELGYLSSSRRDLRRKMHMLTRDRNLDTSNLAGTQIESSHCDGGKLDQLM